ncbi:MAG: hypothetical protein AUH07_08590 [Gemmatimonadetes bacterium 13_2_20CM_70_9]|nr:MAG: hypothetical protein AUH07_08590 [Gemmatimonadetes bacterium 13_2_20CM_70_9]
MTMLQGLQGPPTPPPPGLDWTFLLDQAMPIVVMIVLFIGLRWVLQTPVGEALAERIRTKMRGRPGGIGEDPHRVTALEDQVAQLHGQVAELAERYAPPVQRGSSWESLTVSRRCSGRTSTT